MNPVGKKSERKETSRQASACEGGAADTRPVLV